MAIGRRATSITFGGYENADVPPYNMIRTIHHIPDYGFNDFAVTSMLLAEENRTMVPQIAAFLGTTYTEGNVMFAVSAVVSATVPLLILVMFFQRQIVSGLVAGAVKG
jgi:ABC-type maltose transport system permease subunit